MKRLLNKGFQNLSDTQPENLRSDALFVNLKNGWWFGLADQSCFVGYHWPGVPLSGSSSILVYFPHKGKTGMSPSALFLLKP